MARGRGTWPAGSPRVRWSSRSASSSAHRTKRAWSRWNASSGFKCGIQLLGFWCSAFAIAHVVLLSEDRTKGLQGAVTSTREVHERLLAFGRDVVETDAVLGTRAPRQLVEAVVGRADD